VLITLESTHSPFPRRRSRGRGGGGPAGVLDGDGAEPLGLLQKGVEHVARVLAEGQRLAPGPRVRPSAIAASMGAIIRRFDRCI